MSKAKKHETPAVDSHAAEMSESDATLTAALTCAGSEVETFSADATAAASGLAVLQSLEAIASVSPEPSPESSDHSIQLQYFSAAAGINFLSITQLFTWAITHQAEFTAIVNDLKSAYEKIKLLVPTFPKVFGAATTPQPALSFNHVYGSHSAKAELVKEMAEYHVEGGMESARDWFDKIVKYLPAILKIIAIFAEDEQQ